MSPKEIKMHAYKTTIHAAYEDIQRQTETRLELLLIVGGRRNGSEEWRERKINN